LPGIRVTLKAAKPQPFQKPPETIGEHIKARRLLLGRYQKDVAPELVVDEMTFGNWERGKTILFRRHRQMIAQLLKIGEHDVSVLMRTQWVASHNAMRSKAPTP